MDKDYYTKGRKKIGFYSFFRNVLIARANGKFIRFTSRLLPYQPDFIFFTHPRNEEDIDATIPFIKRLRKVVPSGLIRWTLNLSPCHVVAYVRGPSNKRGYVISVTELPERLFASRELTARLIKESVSFFKKISPKKIYVGLAAWWPIVSNSGLVFQKYLAANGNILVTSGHTATLASIFLSVTKLSEIFQIPLSELKLLIIGVGKVGGALADLFIGKVQKLGLVDKNPMRIQSLSINLTTKSNASTIEPIPVDDADTEGTICRKIQEYDITVCTTSNIGLLVKDPAKLQNCVILDDSRPEAFPRVFSRERGVVVLEGGLMRIPGIRLDSDFGFGKEENVFGCLSEAVILALDGGKTIQPNIGEVDYENLLRLIEFCNHSGITVGEFKCGTETIKPADLSKLTSLNR